VIGGSRPAWGGGGDGDAPALPSSRKETSLQFYRELVVKTLTAYSLVFGLGGTSRRRRFLCRNVARTTGRHTS